RLPDIKLPKFNGDYSAWPSFRELFTSIIMECPRLNNVERLHYLRSCVHGPAEQLIRSLPMTGDSLQASWDLLIVRYENKRLIIQAHLDNLFNLSMATPKNAAFLTKLISTVSESNKALQSLGMTQDMWACWCIMSHAISTETPEKRGKPLLAHLKRIPGSLSSTSFSTPGRVPWRESRWRPLNQAAQKVRPAQRRRPRSVSRLIRRLHRRCRAERLTVCAHTYKSERRF
ncbi:hypothetical protein X777_14098, partial [Ooceraea biroi]